jgi:GrpB-like predicted nucleotidyltransferase (UPF0157 family)
MDDVRLEPDPVWTDRFEEERTRIRDAASDGLLGVFHVGSTAIPDLPAKPLLDVLAVFEEYESARTTADALAAEGYDVRKDEPEWIQLTRTGGDDSVFLHFRPEEPDVWRDQLVFRDYLRENPQARREYERVKREAAAAHPNDPEAYTKAKEEIVLSLEERAYEEGYDERLPDFG